MSDRHLIGAIEMQEHEPARRLSEILNARNSLLASVAALLQVHR